MERPLEAVRAAWEKTVDAMKQGPVNVTLWEALEACVPLAFHDGKLYLGLTALEMRRVATLQAVQTQAALQSHVARFLEEPSARLIYFEGTDQEAYEGERQREEARAQAAQQARAARENAQAALRGWDWLANELQKHYNATPEKSLPWNVVGYYREALALTLRVETEQKEAGADARDLSRGLVRSLHRIAEHVELPLVLVTMEYMKLRGDE